MHAAADVDVELLLRPDELDVRLNVEPMPDWWAYAPASDGPPPRFATRRLRPRGGAAARCAV